MRTVRRAILLILLVAGLLALWAAGLPDPVRSRVESDRSGADRQPDAPSAIELPRVKARDPEPPDAKATPQKRSKRPATLRVRVTGADGVAIPVALARVSFRGVHREWRTTHSWDPAKPGVLRVRDGVIDFDPLESFESMNADATVTLELFRAATSHSHRRNVADEPLPFGPITIGPVPLVGEYAIRLPAENRVAGVVVDEQGEPVRNAVVWAWHPDRTPGQEPILVGDYDHYGRDKTDAGGAFRIGRLGAGTVDLVVDPPRGYLPPGAVTARPGENLRIVLRRGAGAVVRVVDSKSRPVVGADVRVGFRHWNEPFREQRKGFWHRSTYWHWTTDERGQVQFTGFEPTREYRLTVRPTHNPVTLATASILRWQVADTTVSLGSSFSLSGVVIDSKGEPRPHAHVYATFSNGAGRLLGRDATGRFQLNGIPEGAVVITASIRGWREGSEAVPITVNAGDRDVKVIIDRPPSIFVQIREWPAGTKFVRARLRPESNGWGAHNPYVSTDGRIEVVGPEAGQSWTLFVGGLEDGRYALVNGIKTSTDVHEIDLKPGGEIRGVVQFPAGETMCVVSIVDRFVFVSAIAKAGEQFVIKGVPPGKWKVEASLDDKSDRDAKTTAQAGDLISLDLR